MNLLRLRHLFLAVALVCASVAHARGDKVLDMPLQWSPTSTLAEMGAVDISGALLTRKIQLQMLTDVRSSAGQIAENREDAGKVKPVTTSSDVAAYVTDHLRDTLRSAGLSITDGGADFVVTGELRKFFTTETDNYRGEMTLLLHLSDKSGKELWTGIIIGGAEHFGRSYRADNYNETFSDVILRASYNLIANAGFRAALGQK